MGAESTSIVFVLQAGPAGKPVPWDTCMYFFTLVSVLSTFRNSCYMKQFLDSWSTFCLQQFFVLWQSRILFFQVHMCSHIDPALTAEPLGTLPTELGFCFLGPIQKSWPHRAWASCVLLDKMQYGSVLEMCMSLCSFFFLLARLISSEKHAVFHSRNDICVKGIMLSIENHKLVCIFTANLQGRCSSVLAFWTAVLLWLFS